MCTGPERTDTSGSGGVALYAAFWRWRRMKKKRTAARMTTPTNAAIEIPATAPRVSGEEPSELPALDEQLLPEQVDESESLGVIVTIFCSAPSFHAHADTLKTPRS